MSAKEERALHLEVHHMNRVNGEMAARNAALESECARLRMGLKHDHAKLVASHDALLQKCKDIQAAEHDRLARLQMERQSMVATMQREQDELFSRLQQEMQQKTWEKRQTALNEIIVMKQNLEAHYVDIIGKKTQELDAVKKSLEDQLISEKNALTLQLMKTVSFSHISRAIAANHAHAQLIYNLGFRDKRVLIYSHYSDRDEVESYNYLTLQHMEDRFDYVIVLTNCANKWYLPNSNYNKFHVLGYNFKSDFRNYAMFIMQTEKTLVHASQLCLMNDSFVIVDVLAYDRCMKHLFEPAVAHDFVGITSSHESVYHLQSYFICFNTNSIIKAVVNYFDVHGLPMNHNASISVYELGITQHLVKQGFTPYAMVSNTEMQFPLNTTYFKWSAVLQHAGIIKRQHLLKQYPMRFAMTEYNIALIANKFSENTHFIHYLKYHGINLD